MKPKPKLVIFESHPIQYRVPLYQKLNELRPDSFFVVFASDFSVQGYRDSGFGSQCMWDIPLLEGYPFLVLNPGSKSSPDNFLDLKAPGLFRLINKLKPNAILMTSFNYQCDMVAYLSALRIGLHLWIRMETQDQALSRSVFKSWLRSLIYRSLYQPVKKAFFIGKLNKQHYSKHGIPNHKLFPAHYCTLNSLKFVSNEEKIKLRKTIRESLGIEGNVLIISFFGKFIEKKDPLLLYKCISYLSLDVRNNLGLMFIGNGELKTDLQKQANKLLSSQNIRSYFPGFINQKELPGWYLAADLVVLPSKKMGETWGLVINEALQAGCSVVVSTAVGCHADFRNLERVRTIPAGDSNALAAEVESLAQYSRDFYWAENFLQEYSIESAAQSLAEAIDTI